MVVIKEASTPESYELGKQLFEAYATELQVDLSFQGFAEEMAEIAQQYGRPGGCLYLAYAAQPQPVGCFGIRMWGGTTCELKRMFIRPSHRGLGIGKQLLIKSVTAAYELGYEKMRLDTLPSMQAAIKLYQQLGFYEIPPYRYNPIKGTKYFERIVGA